MNKPYHPAANLFPLLDGDEYAALKQDIAQNGLREAIWLHPDGRILDGRNRYRACVDLGLAPVYRTWEGQGSAVAFVLSLNLHRRHLSSSQRAVLALDVLPMFEAEARERQVEMGRVGRAMQLDGGSQLSDYPPAETGKAAAQAAQATGTNRTYVAQAKEIAAKAPDLLDAVRAGALTVTQARREAVKRTAPPAPDLPSARYRVIYADPPWAYGNTMPEGTTQPSDYYAAMSTPAICALPICDLAEADAALFLWTTSPHLEEAFDVIRAWGFAYKTSFVWDKVKHNMGHYNSVRHEFLLVCTRGACTPDVARLFDSVQVIERTEHSVKPEEFRSIIDTLYPAGRRIELFARRTADGWDRWGNEAG